MRITCKYCGKKFNGYPSAKRKYCSFKCSITSRIGKPSWNKNIKGEGYRFKGEIIKNNCVCKICGKKFHLKPHAIRRGRGKYCSKECYNKGKSKLMKGKITSNVLFSKMGKISKDTIKNLSFYLGKKGKDNPNWKGGQVTKKCKICGREFKVTPARAKIRECCSRKCLGISQRGKKSKFWKGGISYRRGENWNDIRKQVYKRDKWTCQICGKHCREDISCHHIIPYRVTQDNGMENLITLCKSCHMIEEWKYYHKIKKEIYASKNHSM